MSDQDLDITKKQLSIDEMIERRLKEVVTILNNQVQVIYADFNNAMLQQDKKLKTLEIELSNMVTTLWGIVNSGNARMAALESVLIKNGLNPSDLENELTTIIEKMKETGNWVEQSLEGTKGADEQLDGAPPPPPSSGPAPLI